MPHSFGRLPELSTRTGFAGNSLDRLSELRDDLEFCERLRAQASSRVVLVSDDALLIKRRDGAGDPYFTFAEARELGRARETVLLGRAGERALFAAQISVERQEAEIDAGQGRVRLVKGRSDIEIADLRGLATQGALGDETLGVLAQAKSIAFWHARHQFCANCGALTQSASAGWKRTCASCGALHFPRTDPVVIMVVTDGDACLLGRQARFAPGMYSALAGFLEPGETVESAVRREVREETGVRVGAVSYLASQPWPFPSSLMLGCLAQALTREVVIDRAELEDARWFAREEVRAMYAQTHPAALRAPNSIAIAHRLIETWLND